MRAALPPATISESARVSTAAEARFRLAAPNSRPRETRIVALDAAAAEAVRHVAEGEWNGARFLTLKSTIPAGAGLEGVPIDAVFADGAGTEIRLAELLAGADAVVMIATAGSGAPAAAVIGGACAVRGIMATGLIVADGPAAGAVERTLKSLRPHAAMLVVAGGAGYIPEMLSALRA